MANRCDGSTNNPKLKESKAYCEGMLYRTTGTLLVSPKANNPHLAGTPEADAWDRGWDAAETASGGTITAAIAGCCGTIGLIVEA